MPNTPAGILLDIEGTTSSISFVHEVMFPFALDHLDAFLSDNQQCEQAHAAYEQIAKDAGQESLATWEADAGKDASELVTVEVRRLMAEDIKATGLKALQGLIWKSGFESGELKAHVYPDVIPAIERWRESGIDVRIYSSGSIAAQKLFFANLESVGDCLHLFSGHYDTTSGGKKEPQSYLNIAQDWGHEPGKILFVSDIAEELEAAKSSGLQAYASVRPGNSLLPDDLGVEKIASFDEIVC